MNEKNGVDFAKGRTRQFFKTSYDIANYINSLPLDPYDKRRLSLMIYDHVVEAERGAFALGTSYIFGDDF